MGKQWAYGLVLVVAVLGCQKAAQDAASPVARGRAVQTACEAASDTLLSHATTDSAKAVRVARAAYGWSSYPLAVVGFEERPDKSAIIALVPADQFICPSDPTELSDAGRTFRVASDGSVESVGPSLPPLPNDR